MRQNGIVHVQSVSELRPVRPLLADAVEAARRALTDLGEDRVGEHLGVTADDDTTVTHRFAATIPGYHGWVWEVVLSALPDSDRVTVNESALLPGPEALVAPEWLPWDQRVRPGDLSPGDLLAPRADDPRLVPGYVATGDPVVDDVAFEVGLGRKQVMSLEGRLDAAQRWYDGDHGPDSEMAKAAPSTCALCGFYLPLAGSLRAGFGVCGNELSVDGQVVHAEFGCGAHSDTELPTGAGTPKYDAFDDGALEVVELPAPTKTSEAVADVAEPVAEAAETVVEVTEPVSEAAELVAEVAEPVAEAAETVAEVAETGTDSAPAE
jgi:hypothetical protein